MGHKKRNPAPRSRPSLSVDSPDGLPPAPPGDVGRPDSPAEPGPAPDSDPSSVKVECERALNALRRGNHTKALRLMKESSARHVSSALLHRVHGTVSVKVASLIDDPPAKQRHLKNAIESARKAVSLAPNSVEFGHFYANLLFEAASDTKGYEEVVQECERALGITDPVDPAKDSLQEESQQPLTTSAARISNVQQELRSLIQKSNIASISTWMKTLGNGTGEEKFRLIPMRRLSEDPMEVRLVQTRRPNEIKKATKTPEERRKEIEVRVAAARLLQQKSDLVQSNQEEDKAAESNSAPHRGGEKRKLANLRKVTSLVDRKEQVRTYWNSMSEEKKKDLLAVSIKDLQVHLASGKNGLALEVLEEALGFFDKNKSWKFWVCCQCNEKFSESKLHMQHMVSEHMGNLAAKLQSVLPQEVDSEWIEMLVNGFWKPVDVYAAVKMLENNSHCEPLMESNARTNLAGDNDEQDGSHWFSKDDTKFDEEEAQGSAAVSKTEEFCNGAVLERRSHADLSEFDSREYERNGWVKAGPMSQRWPISDDSERTKLLEKIHNLFQLLVRHKHLAASHINKVIQYTVNELQGLALSPQLLNLELDQSHFCICFLGASQLRKILKFLQELCHSCGLARYSEKNASTDEAHSITLGSEILENITLSGDSLCLLLDECLLRARINSNEANIDSGCDGMGTTFSNKDDGGMDRDNLLSWIFSGPSSSEQVVSWTRLREEKTHQGMEVLQMVEKEFYLLQSLCERKCEHLSYEEALEAIEGLCLEELKKRDNSLKFVSSSYEVVLKKRQEDLVERDNDLVFINSRFELDMISKILKEARALNVNQLGYGETSGITSRLCDLEYGHDEDWRMQDYMHQDTCIEVAIQRQKEQLSVELSKVDARIMRSVTDMQLLENKLGPDSAFDYRAIILCLVKSFMQAYLEELADKDATEKSDAAREAFLAELARDAKKSNSKGGDHSKHIHEKSKDKKKNKDYRKAKDSKVFGPNVPHHHQEISEQDSGFDFATYANQRDDDVVPARSDDLKQQEDEFRRKLELEAEERKLEETLEYQRRMENEAKEKHLAEQHKKASGTALEAVTDESFIINSKPNVDYSESLMQTSDSPPGSQKERGHVGCHSPESSFKLDKQINDLGTFGKYFGKHDANLEAERAFSYHEKSLEPYVEGVPPVGQDVQLLKDSGSLHLKPADEILGPGKLSAGSSIQSRRTIDRSHAKSRQGISTRASLEHGVVPPERKSGRKAIRQNSTEFLNGNIQTLPIEKENNELGHLPVEAAGKEPNHSRGQKTYSHRPFSTPLTPTQLNSAMVMKHADFVSKDIGAVSGENTAKTLRQLHVEEDDEERFQADLQKAVQQSLDAFQARENMPVVPLPKLLQKKFQQTNGLGDSPIEIAVNTETQPYLLGTGLQNEVGEYNCFLNVIIQSLWHLRRFREEFLGTARSMHLHVGDPCVICALYDIFTAMSMASVDKQREAVAPTLLRIALSNLYPDSNFFQQAQMNDASEVLSVIFDCLHQSFTFGSGASDAESEESNCMGSWDCTNNSCIAHTLFGMDIYEQMNCYSCGLESRHLKYTSFFHNINASALRTMKIMSPESSLDELMKHVEMNHQLTCDPEGGGCGKLNYIHHFLSTPPHVFTTVLGWQNTRESADAISATLAAITTKLDIGVLYNGVDQGNIHCLVSVVCYYGQHYHCFAYSHEHDQWVMYDDKTVKVIGGWNKVLTMCERGHLQPQVLFFEGVN